MASLAIYQWAGETIEPPGATDNAAVSEARELRCPRTGERISRVLVADLGLGPDTGFLEPVARVCRDCRVWPVVLTVARTEPDARLRQAQTEALFAAHGVSGDFDYAVTVGLRMLRLRRLVEEENGIFRARPEEMPLLTYYANSILHLA